MKRFSTSLLVAAISISLARAPVHAQERELPDVSGECAPEIPEDQRRALIERDGQAGIWFHIDLARCMLARLAVLPEYAQHVRLLEERLTLGGERAFLEARRADLAVGEANVATEALEAAVRARRRAEEDLNAWYRHPALWAVVGLVLGVTLVALSAYVLDAAGD